MANKDREMKMVDGVPHHVYWQGEGHLFHPMHTGQWLYKHPTKANMEALLAVSHLLRNKSLAWFYPVGYKLSRMSGRTMPSCIAQAEFLSAFMLLHSKGIATDEAMRSVFRSFDSDELKDSDGALIEIPLDKSCPEIVLNGWLHALTRIIDYLRYSSDPMAVEILDDSITTLAKRLPLYDCAEHRLSRYSDLCVYAAVIRTDDASDLSVQYGDAAPIPFGCDNRPYQPTIHKMKEGYYRVTFNLSAVYSTTLACNAPFSIKMGTGGYSRMHTNPPNILGTSTWAADAVELDHEYVLLVHDDRFYRGYPTNFAKHGQVNKYHPYHIIALRCIAATYPTRHNATLLEWADRWEGYMDSSRNFYPMEKWLTSFNQGKFYPYRP